MCKKTALSALVIMALLLNLCGYVLAEDSQIQPVENGSATIAIKIESEPTLFSVTLPTNVPIHIDKETVVTCPSAAKTKIVNNGFGTVQVNEVQISNGSWSLVDYSIGKDALALESAGANKIGMNIDLVKINEYGLVSEIVDSAHTKSNENSQSLDIDVSKWRCYPNDTMYLQFSAIVSPLNYFVNNKVQDSVKFENALNMVLIIDWYMGE